MYTFVLFIQIRTSRYQECTITLEVNDRKYMHIVTICKGTVSPELLHSGWGFIPGVLLWPMLSIWY